MDGAYYYVYETTNLTNDKKYIGQHCTRDLEDGYYGSCKELKKDIGNGDEYEVEILKFCKNIWHVGHEEKWAVKRVNGVHSKRYYNTQNPLFINYPFEFGMTDESKRKMSRSSLGNIPWIKGKTHTVESKKKMKGSRESMTGENSPNFGKKGELSPNFGRNHTKDACEKISQALIGKKFSKTHIKNLSLALRGKTSPTKGKKQPTVECEYCGIICSKLNYTRWHGDNCKDNPNSERYRGC